MKFIVRRASAWGSETSPCEEAKRDSIINVDIRTFHSPEEFDERCSKHEGKWFTVGTNHRVDENGHIVRDKGMIDVWSVEINTLDELIEFCNKYESIIIGDYIRNTTYKEILIYDDYIE